jgi:hypothetical protein
MRVVHVLLFCSTPADHAETIENGKLRPLAGGVCSFLVLNPVGRTVKPSPTVPRRQGTGMYGSFISHKFYELPSSTEEAKERSCARHVVGTRTRVLHLFEVGLGLTEAT